ncbi:putative lipid-transfer protein DIR1 [Papaver somniferum]|uniref:putative lipid-transfer protein DIR1 n=1 Tax=Papaver somniferum TaxID=3469 RepID=UPI000E700885|nr:putative lipid-transfer protein DIR1 [Papaver somniferum]
MTKGSKTSDLALSFAMAVVVLMIGIGVKGVTICNMDSSQLAECLPAISSGQASPPPPTPGCCDVMKLADMHCLCTYKVILPAFGVDPELAMGVPKKCNLTAPPECNGA